MKWLLYAFLSTSIYAFIPILDKINCSRLDPMLIATSSSILSSMLLIMYCLVNNRFGPSLSDVTYTDVVYIFGAAMLTAVSWAFYYGAVKVGPISKISMLDSVSFVLTILFSAFILQEAVAIQTVFGIIIIVLGMFIVVH